MPLGTHDGAMGLELRPGELEGTAILGRRFEDGTLKVVPAPGEEVTVVCDCGCSHWLVAVREEAHPLLTLTCHRCASRYDLPYRGPLPEGG